VQPADGAAARAGPLCRFRRRSTATSAAMLRIVHTARGASLPSALCIATCSNPPRCRRPVESRCCREKREELVACVLVRDQKATPLLSRASDPPALQNSASGHPWSEAAHRQRTLPDKGTQTGGFDTPKIFFFSRIFTEGDALIGRGEGGLLKLKDVSMYTFRSHP